MQEEERAEEGGWLEEQNDMLNDINPPSAISEWEVSRGVELVVRGTGMRTQGRNDGHL